MWSEPCISLTQLPSDDRHRASKSSAHCRLGVEAERSDPRPERVRAHGTTRMRIGSTYWIFCVSTYLTSVGEHASEHDLRAALMQQSMRRLVVFACALTRSFVPVTCVGFLSRKHSEWPSHAIHAFEPVDADRSAGACTRLTAYAKHTPQNREITKQVRSGKQVAYTARSLRASCARLKRYRYREIARDATKNRIMEDRCVGESTPSFTAALLLVLVRRETQASSHRTAVRPVRYMTA